MEGKRENEESFFKVQNWMITELQLRGTSLLVYALLYSYTVAQGEFTGSLGYIAKRINSNVSSVQRALKSLVQKGLLGREDVFLQGVKYVKYHTQNAQGDTQNEHAKPMQEMQMPYANCHGGMQEMHMGDAQNEQGVIGKTTNNTKVYTKENTKENTYVCGASVPQDALPKQGDTPTPSSCMPSLEEVRTYCRELQSPVDADAFFNYYAACGWMPNGRPIVDWRAKLRYWDQKDRAKGMTTHPANIRGAGQTDDYFKVLFSELGGERV